MKSSIEVRQVLMYSASRSLSLTLATLAAIHPLVSVIQDALTSIWSYSPSIGWELLQSRFSERS